MFFVDFAITEYVIQIQIVFLQNRNEDLSSVGTIPERSFSCSDLFVLGFYANFNIFFIISRQSVYLTGLPV